MDIALIRSRALARLESERREIELLVQADRENTRLREQLDKLLLCIDALRSAQKLENGVSAMQRLGR